jgi:hypothetical protein
MFLSCIDSGRDELDASSSYPMVQDKTTGADRPRSFHDTTFVDLVQPLLAIIACKTASSNRPPSGPFFAKGSADLVLSSQAKAFMHKKFIQAILPRPLEAFVRYIVCKQIATYHLDQLIEYAGKRNSGIGFLAQERLVDESDKWCDKAVNPQCQPSMRAKETEANLLVYKMLLGKVKTERDSVTSLYKMYKQDKAKYLNLEMNGDQQPLTSPPELPSVVLLGTFFLPSAENEVKKEKDTTGKRKRDGSHDEDNVEDGSSIKHCCLFDDEVGMEEVSTIAFPLCLDNKSSLLLCSLQ